MDAQRPGWIAKRRNVLRRALAHGWFSATSVWVPAGEEIADGSAHRIEDAFQAMAHVVNRAGEHGADNLEEDEARSRIDVGSSRPFKRDK